MAVPVGDSSSAGEFRPAGAPKDGLAPRDDPQGAVASAGGDAMCRWIAYTGSPLLVEDLLYVPENSLIVQSLHARLGVEPTNGDGFGLGWYGDQELPGLYRSIEPA